MNGHRQARRDQGPIKVSEQHRTGNWYARANAKIALWVTVAVGSMTCAWLFGLLALAGLPTALEPGNIGLLFWFSSDFLQLTLLSVILVGQNIQAKASDKRAEQTYNDVELLLYELDQIKALLAAGRAEPVAGSDSGESDVNNGAAGDVRWSEPAGFDGDPYPHGEAGTPQDPEGYGTGPRPLA